MNHTQQRGLDCHEQHITHKPLPKSPKKLIDELICATLTINKHHIVEIIVVVYYEGHRRSFDFTCKTLLVLIYITRRCVDNPKTFHLLFRFIDDCVLITITRWDGNCFPHKTSSQWKRFKGNYASSKQLLDGGCSWCYAIISLSIDSPLTTFIYRKGRFTCEIKWHLCVWFGNCYAKTSLGVKECARRSCALR